MTDILSLDEGYSTTRLIFNDKCLMLNEDNSQFNIENSTSKKGDLRTKGYFKKSFDDKPLISIITVVFNGEKYLEETIQSVINQTYDNVEYIIIDGGSTDGTLDIIKKYEDKIDYWVSEKDRGIYDAMNKGIDVASGEWINFMNAGDSFYNEKVLENLFNNNIYENIDVLYGNYNVIYPTKNRIAIPGKENDFWKGSQICHQSSFTKASLLKIYKYNIKNKISAEFEFFYELHNKNGRFEYIDVILTNYLSGGVSDMKRIYAIVSFWNIVDKNTKTNLYYIYRILLEILKSWVKKVVKI